MSHGERACTITPAPPPQVASRQRAHLLGVLRGKGDASEGALLKLPPVQQHHTVAKREADRPTGFDTIQRALVSAVQSIGETDGGAPLVDETWLVLSRHIHDVLMKGSRETRLQRIEQLCSAGAEGCRVVSAGALSAMLDTVLAFCTELSPQFHDLAISLRKAYHLHMFCTVPQLERIVPIETSNEFEALQTMYSRHRTFRDLVGSRQKGGEAPKLKLVRSLLDTKAQGLLRTCLRGWRGVAQWETKFASYEKTVAAKGRELELWRSRAGSGESKAHSLEVGLKHHQVRAAAQLKETTEALSNKIAGLTGELSEAKQRISRLEADKAELLQKITEMGEKHKARDKELRAGMSGLTANLEKYIPSREPESHPCRTELIRIISEHDRLDTAMSAWIKQRCAGLWDSVSENESALLLFDTDGVDPYSSGILNLPIAAKRTAEEKALTDVKGILLALHTLAPQRLSPKDIDVCETSTAAMQVLTTVGSTLRLNLPIVSLEDMRSHLSFRLAAAVAVAKAVLDVRVSHSWLIAPPSNGGDAISSPLSLRNHGAEAVQARVATYESTFARRIELAETAATLDAILADTTLSYLAQVADSTQSNDRSKHDFHAMPEHLNPSALSSRVHDEEEQQECAQILSPHIPKLREIFAYYSLADTMGRIEVASFLRDTSLWGNEGASYTAQTDPLRRKSVNRVQVGVWVELLKKLDVDENTQLDFEGFLSILPPAAENGLKSSATQSFPASDDHHLVQLMEQHVIPNTYCSTLTHLLTSLADDEVERVFELFKTFLSRCFTKYSTPLSHASGTIGEPTPRGPARKKSILQLQYARITLQGFKRMADDLKFVDEGFTHIALQQSFQRLLEDGREGLKFSGFLALLAVVSHFKFPTPFYPVAQKIHRFLSQCCVRAGSESIKRRYAKEK